MAELLVVVVIMGILTALGLVFYRKAAERRYFGESQNLLYAIYSGQRAYYFSNGAYFDNPSSDADWRLIHTDNPNDLDSLPVTFSVTSPGATFTATATRNGGACDSLTITIPQDRVLGGTWSGCSDM